MNWFAIFTKHRPEDFVAACLSGARIEPFNPKPGTMKFSWDRLVENIESLFRCYIFARFDPERSSHRASYTRRVGYVVGKRNPIVVHDWIIEAI